MKLYWLKNWKDVLNHWYNSLVHLWYAKWPFDLMGVKQAFYYMYYAIVPCALLCEDLDFVAFLLWFAVNESISRTHEIKFDSFFLRRGGGLTMHVKPCCLWTFGF